MNHTIKKFFQNTRRPEGYGGKIMVSVMNRGHAPLSKWGFTYLSPRKDDSVLDIGCGGGANIAKLLKKCADGTVTGIDYSQVSVDKAAFINRKAVAAGRCIIVRGSVSDLPFEDDTFNLVTAFETVYFWPDIVDSFRNVYRVLKNDGIFFICNETDGQNKNDQRWTDIIDGFTIYTAGQLAAYLREAGFSETVIAGNGDKHWVCVMAKKKGTIHI
ncbi:MAG TPA: SAM-dependent methyltransferase [Treponema sp.]|nr:SAM-dependent methyltransferase [Treponema sp.]